MSTRNISWGWRRPVRSADNLTTFMCRLSWNLGTSTSWKSLGLSRPVMELLPCFTLRTGHSRRARANVCVCVYVWVCGCMCACVCPLFKRSIWQICANVAPKFVPIEAILLSVIIWWVQKLGETQAPIKVQSVNLFGYIFSKYKTSVNPESLLGRWQKPMYICRQPSIIWCECRLLNVHKNLPCNTFIQTRSNADDNNDDDNFTSLHYIFVMV